MNRQESEESGHDRAVDEGARGPCWPWRTPEIEAIVDAARTPTYLTRVRAVRAIAVRLHASLRAREEAVTAASAPRAVDYIDAWHEVTHVRTVIDADTRLDPRLLASLRGYLPPDAPAGNPDGPRLADGD